MRSILILLLAVPLWRTWADAGVPTREPARVIRVISGDTLTVQYRQKWEELRLLGVDSPEMTANNKTYEVALQTGTTPDKIIAQGKMAAEFVKQVIHYGSQIWLEFDARKRDRHGRLLAYVFLPGGVMLNERLLEAGYARLMPIPSNLRYRHRLTQAFRLATENQRGFWSMNGNR